VLVFVYVYMHDVPFIQTVSKNYEHISFFRLSLLTLKNDISLAIADHAGQFLMKAIICIHYQTNDFS
jgi:hypothetical protein